MRLVDHFVSLPKRSMLTRLVGLNMLGLLVLVGGFLILHEARQILTGAYRQSLEAQARLIAGSLSNAARSDSPFQFLEPSLLDRLLRDGQSQVWALRDAERVMGQARQISTARLRLYGRNGNLILDSASMGRSAQVIAKKLPPMDEPMPLFGLPLSLKHLLRAPAPLLSEINAANGRSLSEVASALRGRAASLQRQSEDGGDILTVAVPVQGYRAINGALMLSTQPGEIDRIVAEERQLVLQLSAIALAVNIATSLLLAGLLIGPVRRLAAAMRGFANQAPSLPGLESIPDYTKRGDEIGELSSALRGMTQRLVERIHTIDRFAADVAHELKNPLTSLHSAVQNIEQTDRAKNPAAYEQMMAIIHNDVNRLNRLISDIANATRLDAELNQGVSAPFDLSVLAQQLADAFGDTMSDNQKAEGISVRAQIEGNCMVLGQKPRIAQIIDNLISNAISFSPPGGRVSISVKKQNDNVSITVADEGPGLAPDTAEKIFERFYTDRTNQPEAASQNAHKAGHSGLGLSISRQIAHAHGGELLADNRPDGIGAYFTLTLPQHNPDHKTPRGRSKKSKAMER